MGLARVVEAVEEPEVGVRHVAKRPNSCERELDGRASEAAIPRRPRPAAMDVAGTCTTRLAVEVAAEVVVAVDYE